MALVRPDIGTGPRNWRDWDGETFLDADTGERVFPNGVVKLAPITAEPAIGRGDVPMEVDAGPVPSALSPEERFEMPDIGGFARSALERLTIGTPEGRERVIQPIEQAAPAAGAIYAPLQKLARAVPGAVGLGELLEHPALETTSYVFPPALGALKGPLGQVGKGAARKALAAAAPAEIAEAVAKQVDVPREIALPARRPATARTGTWITAEGKFVDPRIDHGVSARRALGDAGEDIATDEDAIWALTQTTGDVRYRPSGNEVILDIRAPISQQQWDAMQKATRGRELIYDIWEPEGRRLAASKGVSTKVTIQDLEDDLAKQGFLPKAAQEVEPPPGLASEGVPPPPAEPPASLELPPPKERGFAETVRTAELTPPGIQEELARNIRTYDPITNAKTVREATELLDNDLAQAKRLVLDSSDAPDALTVVTGELLAHRLIRSTDTSQVDEGLRVLDKLFERATTGGQGIQAFSIYGRLSPEGILGHAQRVVKQAQQQFPGVKLTADKAQEFTRRAEALQGMAEGREKILASAELMRDVYGLVPRSTLSKIAFAQTIAQLLNPKTWVRNIFGNTFFWGAENLARLVASGYDVPLALMTGERAVRPPAIRRQLGGLVRGAREANEEVARGLNLRNLPTQFDLGTGKGFHSMGPMFKGVPVLEQAEKALSYGLRIPDRAFFEAAFDDGLWNWAQREAQRTGKDALELFAKPTKDGIDEAYYQGLYRTFQDESLPARMFTTIKQGLNVGKDFGIGDLVLKYPRTPGNLLARGVEYTPFGFFQGLLEIAKPVFTKRPFNQKAFVETLGRATVGTVGLTLPGAYLASLGVLTGRGPKDKDLRALQRETGERPYSFNLTAFKRLIFSGFSPDMAQRQAGDKLITYDWALPLSLPITMAAEAGQPAPKKLGPREAPSVLDFLSDNLLVNMGAAAIDATAVGIDTIAVQPMMQGLQKLFGGHSPGESLAKILSEMPSSLTPTILSQVNQLLDNTLKETWRPEVWEQSLTTIMARIPILASALPDKVNVWGEPADRYAQDSNHPFNVFLNPAFISDYFPRPEAEMLLDVHKATGQTTPFPRVTDRSITIDGRKYELTTEQAVEYQGLLGQMTRKAYSELAQSESFQQADPEAQAQFMARTLNALSLNARLELHKRYSEASGAVNPLPAPKTSTVGAFGRFIGEDAARVWQDEETLKVYKEVPEALQAANATYRDLQERHDAASAAGDQAAVSRLERDVRWKAYQNLIEWRRNALRRRPDVFEAGRRLYGWERTPK